jgi:hypothetical protein
MFPPPAPFFCARQRLAELASRAAKPPSARGGSPVHRRLSSVLRRHSVVTGWAVRSGGARPRGHVCARRSRAASRRGRGPPAHGSAAHVLDRGARRSRVPGGEAPRPVLLTGSTSCWLRSPSPDRGGHTGWTRGRPETASLALQEPGSGPATGEAGPGGGSVTAQDPEKPGERRVTPRTLDDSLRTRTSRLSSWPCVPTLWSCSLRFRSLQPPGCGRRNSERRRAAWTSGARHRARRGSVSRAARST